LVRALLSDHPVRDDALVCLSELASNAIEHTESKNSMFTVDVRVLPQSVRIEVRDAGGPNVPVLRPFNEEPLEGGRGLAIVAALSARMGVEGDEHGRVVWAELSCGLEPFPEDFDTPVIHGWTAWFGQRTGRWWAVPCEPLLYLVEASSEEALAERIAVIEADDFLSSCHRRRRRTS
jgi:hypothetical protein